MIEEFEKLIPKHLMRCSGSVFYSGRKAFKGTKPFYILGANPGGAPSLKIDRTIQWHTNQVIREHPNDWSAYRDEAWNGNPKGTYGMQPRLLHMFKEVGFEPNEIPASNIVFVRSRGVQDIPEEEFIELQNECWEFHKNVINKLNVHTILCLGQDSGNFVREKIRTAEEPIVELEEGNERGWVSRFYRNEKTSMKVVVATHPSRADWTTLQTDPTELINEAINYPL